MAGCSREVYVKLRVGPRQTLFFVNLTIGSNGGSGRPKSRKGWIQQVAGTSCTE